MAVICDTSVVYDLWSGFHMVGSATRLARSVSEAINPGTSLTLRANMARHWSWRWWPPT